MLILSLNEFFAGQETAWQLFQALRELVGAIGPVELRVMKSQVAFRRRKVFAWAWIPAKYLRRQVAPLVLTVALPGRDCSLRWKQVVEPAPGRFIHHLELFSSADLDDEVRAWL